MTPKTNCQRLDFDIETKYRPRHVKALNLLCSKAELYPQGLILKDEPLELKSPRHDGGFGLIYRTELRGHTVAVKLLKGKSDLKVRGRSWRYNSHTDPSHQNFVSEAVTWLHMDHPRILPFYGLCISSEYRIGFVSPWMKQGNVVSYLKSHPNTNCLYLVCIRQFRYVIMVPDTIQRQRISSMASSISTKWISFMVI